MLENVIIVVVVAAIILGGRRCGLVVRERTGKP